MLRVRKLFKGRSRKRLIIILLAILISIVAVATVARKADNGRYETAGEPVALGAYIPGAPADPTKIDQFTEEVGTPPAIVMWYQRWAHEGVREFDPAKMDAVVSRGAMPMVTWAPRDNTRGKNQPKYALRRIIAGKHDDYIREWARDAAGWGKPMYLRFAHEMNGDWYPWSPDINGNTSDEYVAAWRHVVDIFREEGATNVRWVWSPAVLRTTGTPLSELYPGDDYVDWVGLDGYNWGTSEYWSSWQTLAEVFRPIYDEATAVAPGKPIMITETSSTEVGGDKATWIRDAFGTDISSRLPATKAVIWFDQDSEEDWRIDSSWSSRLAYSEVAASPAYQGRLP